MKYWFPLIPAFCMLVCHDFANAEAIEFGKFYRVQKGNNEGYLVPSAHEGGSVEVRLSPSLQRVVTQSGEVAFESFPSWSRQRQAGNIGAVVRTIMSLPKTARLDDELDPMVKSAIMEYLSRHKVPPSAWEAVQFYRVQFARDVLTYLPAIAGNQQQDQRAASRKSSIDMLIYQLANSNSTPIVELEGAPRAARAALAVSTEEANAEIAHFLRSQSDAPGQSVDIALHRLLSGDVEGHYAEYRARECGEPILEAACRKRTDARNSYIAKRIAERVDSGQRPVAVLGALHFGGTGSVLAELRAAGFTVTAAH